jgi:hypothetical protein
MRATHSHANRRTGGVVATALVIASAMLFSSIGAGIALAATPNLVVTGGAAPGTAGDHATTAEPTSVSTNETIQFTTSIKNVDTSNVSQLYFDILGNPAGFKVTKLTSSRSGNVCSLTTMPLCSFGALRPNESVTMTVVLTAPPTASSQLTSCEVGSDAYLGSHGSVDFGGPAFCVDLRWYANGAPTSDGGTSHGDFFDWFDGAGLNGDAQDFKGRFVYQNGQKVVANNQNLGNSNKQSTQASVNNLNIGVTVQDGASLSDICTGVIELTGGGTFDCDTLTSETSIVDVDKGNIVALFAILVKFQTAPTNLKGSSPMALHEYIDPDTLLTIREVIADTCILQKNGTPTAASPIPCLAVANGGKQATIWNDHNGKFQY